MPGEAWDSWKRPGRCGPGGGGTGGGVRRGCPSRQPGPRTAPAGDSAVVASLLARAEQMPSDPLDQLRELSGASAGTGAPPIPGAMTESPAAAKPAAPAPSSPATKGQTPQADSVGGWWQRQRAGDKD